VTLWKCERIESALTCGCAAPSSGESVTDRRAQPNISLVATALSSVVEADSPPRNDGRVSNERTCGATEIDPGVECA